MIKAIGRACRGAGEKLGFRIRPSIPVGRQLIDQTFNKKRDKQMADDLSTAMLYLLYTNKVKREQTEDGIPKFWLASRETPTDANGQEIALVGGLSRQFHYRLISGDKCIETNVVGVGDSVAGGARSQSESSAKVKRE